MNHCLLCRGAGWVAVECQQGANGLLKCRACNGTGEEVDPYREAREEGAEEERKRLAQQVERFSALSSEEQARHPLAQAKLTPKQARALAHALRQMR